MRDRILTASDVDAIADAIAQKIGEIVAARPTTFGLVDARELAEELGVSIDYVYAHAAELGAMRQARRRGSGSISTGRAKALRPSREGRAGDVGRRWAR